MADRVRSIKAEPDTQGGATSRTQLPDRVAELDDQHRSVSSDHEQPAHAADVPD
jgi:hypothetical protein